MCWRWTHRRKSSFKKISVTESMFTIIEARKRTRVFGNSCAVLQFCPCLLPTASLRLSSQSSFPGARHLSQTRSASPGSRTHTSGSASQSRSSKPRGAAARIAPRWHRGTGAAPAAARHAAAAGSPRGRRWAPLAAAGGRHRAARGGGAERPARSPPCPALPALPAPGHRRLCPPLSLSRFSNLSSFFFFLHFQLQKRCEFCSRKGKRFACRREPKPASEMSRLRLFEEWVIAPQEKAPPLSLESFIAVNADIKELHSQLLRVNT